MKEAEEQPSAAWWKAPARQWTLLLQERDEQVFLVLTLLIGALVGAIVVAFILLTERFGARLYPGGGAAWRRLLVPLTGSLGMGYLLFRYFPEARGSGVPQTKAALFAREGRITLGTVVGKFFCTSATLASGIPLGREGPAVQVGAGLASVLGRKLGLRPEKVKALLPVGAAAAIAAAFNTPLAAVLFALEEVVGDLHAPVLGSVVLASATSWAMLRLLLGNDPLFQVPQYQLVSPLEFVVYAVLGVAGGLVSVVFTKLLLGMRERFLRFPRKTVWLQPLAGGLVVGLMGWFVPQVLGVGYKHVGDALNGGMAVRLMVLLLILKLLAVTISYASGNAGRDYAVVVPLMISNLVSFFISSRLQRQPIYDVLARQDGIHLPNAETRQQQGQLRVIQAMRTATEILATQMTVGEALEKTQSSQFRSWPVVDERGVMGIVGRSSLQKALAEGATTIPLSGLVDSRDFPHVHVDQSLHLALERMGAAQLDTLPVVSRADVHKLEGIVTLQDVLGSYGVDLQGPK
ncbi:MAG: hypothetical protein DMG53_17140 [Acidobacteria bacterium]|nr:MAG: hypothetical protein DMG53_17140 [Acidobacteriota bacterium]